MFRGTFCKNTGAQVPPNLYSIIGEPMSNNNHDFVSMDNKFQFPFYAVPKAVDDMMITGKLSMEDYRNYRLIRNTCKYDRFFIGFTPKKTGQEWADKFGLNRRAVRYIMKSLEDHGIIKRFPAVNGQSGVQIAVFPRPFTAEEVSRVFDVVSDNPNFEYGIHKEQQLESEQEQKEREELRQQLKEMGDTEKTPKPRKSNVGDIVDNLASNMKAAAESSNGLHGELSQMQGWEDCHEVSQGVVRWLWDGKEKKGKYYADSGDITEVETLPETVIRQFKGETRAYYK